MIRNPNARIGTENFGKYSHILDIDRSSLGIEGLVFISAEHR